MLVQMERTPVYNHIPDLCLLGLGAAAVASAWLWPWTVVLPGWLRLVGGALIVAAALVIGAVLGALRRAATSTNPVDEPTALLASGPFSLSRNPLYLAYVLAVLGCALASGSWAALLCPVVCFSVLNCSSSPSRRGPCAGPSATSTSATAAVRGAGCRRAGRGRNRS